MKGKNCFSESGFTLIEVLIALSIFSIGILAVGGMQISAIKGNAFASDISEALVLAQRKVNDLNMLASTWSNWGVTTLAPPDGITVTATQIAAAVIHLHLVPNASPHSESVKKYTVEWTITDRKSGAIVTAKQVKITVRWQQGTKSISLDSFLLHPWS